MSQTSIFQLIASWFRATNTPAMEILATGRQSRFSPASITARQNGQHGGFTLVELMITIVIASLLLTMGIPSLSNLLQNNRLATQANDFIAAINFARSEAIKRGVNIDVIATDSSEASNEWGSGWTVQQSGTVLRLFPALSGSSTFNSNSSRSQFTYNSRGRVNNTDTLDLCDSRTGETGRQITISPTGRVSSAEVTCS